MAHIKELYRPAPALVDAKQREWAIRDDSAAPRMSFQAETIWVPLDGSQVSIDIRAHELAHIRWTPEDAYEQLSEFPPDLVNAAEDGRINALLEARGIRAPDYSEHPIYDEANVRDSFARHPMIAAMMRYCAEGTGWKARAQEILEEMYPQDAPWINAQAERLSVEDAEFDVVKDVVRETYEVYCMEQPPPEPGDGESGESGEGDQQQGQAGKSSQGESGEPGEGEESEGESGGSGEPTDGDESEQSGQSSGGQSADGSQASGKAEEGNGQEQSGESNSAQTPSNEVGDGAGSGTSSGAGSTSNEASTPGTGPDAPPAEKGPARPRPESPLDPGEVEVPTDSAPWKATEALKEEQEANAQPEPKIGDPDNGMALEIEGNDEEEGIRDGVKGLWEIRDRRPAQLRDGTANWISTVHVMTPELTQDLPRAHRAAKRGEFYGRAPRYPHRMATDRRIFARKQGGNQYPGTVLVDVSGSMALSGVDIGEVLDRYPTAEIRDYSACFVNGFGHLRVVAKDGKRLTDRELDANRACSSCRSNGIDGPALRWLATQPRPRFWISDGMVNGQREMMTVNLLEECAQLCAQHRIIRVPSVAEFLRKYC